MFATQPNASLSLSLSVSVNVVAFVQAYYGEALRGKSHISRFIEKFEEPDGDLWLVFYDEGYSLVNHLFQPDSNLQGALRPVMRVQHTLVNLSLCVVRPPIILHRAELVLVVSKAPPSRRALGARHGAADAHRPGPQPPPQRDTPRHQNGQPTDAPTTPHRPENRWLVLPHPHPQPHPHTHTHAGWPHTWCVTSAVVFQIGAVLRRFRAFSLSPLPTSTQTPSPPRPQRKRMTTGHQRRPQTPSMRRLKAAAAAAAIDLRVIGFGGSRATMSGEWGWSCCRWCWGGRMHL